MILFFVPSSLPAQINGIISGTVSDDTGAVLPGVSILVRNQETGVVRTVVTDDSGLYSISQLGLGNYEVQADLPGFKTTVRSGITLTVGREAVVNIAMSVGEISERVVVSGEAPLVETTSSSIGGLVDDKKIRDLPLNGRNFTQLALLQTGVAFFAYAAETASAVNGTGMKFSVNGSRPTNNNFMIDGVNMADAGGSTPGSATGQNLGVEAIREFSILTNTYSAAFGRNSGGVINIVSQSGTNTWRGSLFEFLRNSALDAKNFFDRLDTKIPHFTRNQYGFAIGGPLRKDKTFVFGNYERLSERLGLSLVGNVPNASARQGLVRNPTTGQVTDVGLNPRIVPYLNLYPLPNGRDFGDGTGEFLSSPTKASDEDYVMVRLDHEFSPQDSIFVRYNYDNGSIFAPHAIPSYADKFVSRTQSAAIQEKRIFSPSVVNTATFGFNRAFLNQFGIPLVPEAAAPSLSFIPGARYGTILTTSLVSLGYSLAPQFNALNAFQYADDVRWSKGKHNIQLGANISRVQTNIAVLSNVGTWGSYGFTGLVGFLQGSAQSFTAQPPTAVNPATGQEVATSPQRGWRQTNMGFYFQDDIKLRPNLTLNLGLRNESMTTISEANGRQSTLRTLLDSAWTIGVPIFDNPGLAWQPRIGLAWDPFGDGRTAVRAGFGIFNDIIVGTNYTVAQRLSFPWGLQRAVINPAPSTFPNAFALINTGSSTPTVDHINPNVQFPSKIHFNLNVERELAGKMTLTVAYVGSQSYHLFRRYDANTANPEYRADGSKFFPAGLTRRNPAFDFIQENSSEATASFHSLQLGLNRRFNNGLQFQGSYTWSKSVDDFSQELGSQGSGAYEYATQYDNRKADRAVSNWDVKNNAIINFTYELPSGADLTGLMRQLTRGWTVNGIFAFTSGPPFTVLTGVNRSRSLTRSVQEFVDYAPGLVGTPILGGPDRYFDVNALVLPELGTYGKVGRNTIRGPGYRNIDLALGKSFPVTEARYVQFRAEMFNILNHPNFGRPNGTLFTSTGARLGAAGRISRTVNASRQIQFGLKIVF